MRNRIPLSTLILAILITWVPAQKQPPIPQLEILSVYVDFSVDRVEVEADHLDNGNALSIELGGYLIPAEDVLQVCIEVCEETEEPGWDRIVFVLPPEIPDGDHKLVVRTGTSPTQEATYSLTLGSSTLDGHDSSYFARSSDLLATQDDLGNHVNDKNNPHFVRGDQITAGIVGEPFIDPSITRDSELGSQLNAEVQARQFADTAITSSLNAEVAARQAADATITSDLNAEVAARQVADNVITSSLNLHKGDAGNPHSVTLAQLGAVASAGGSMTGSLDVRADVKGPVNDANNPFSVGEFLPDHHAVIIENSRRAENPCTPLGSCEFDKLNTGGLAIVLNTNGNDPSNPLKHPLESINTNDHFVSFFMKDQNDVLQMAGRIEGVTLTDLTNIITKFGTAGSDFFTGLDGFVKFVFEFNPPAEWIVPNVTWPSLSGGTLPSLAGGSLPLLTGGSLPSLAGGSLPRFYPGGSPKLDPDTNYPECEGSCSPVPGSGTGCIEFCVEGVVDINYHYPVPSLDPGSFPSLNRGSFPTLSPGVFPTLNVGAFPTLSPGSIDFSASKGPIKSFGIGFDEKVAAAAWDRSKNNFGGGAALALELRFNPGAFATRYAKALPGVGVTYESGSGDYAEWLERLDPAEEIDIADVVGVFGGKITRRTEGADNVMVVSYKPIVLGNMPDQKRAKDYEKVAFMGQTMVKVRGQVRKGDFIIPSGDQDGSAVAVSPDSLKADQLHQVIGISWGTSHGTRSVSFVNVAMGLRPVEVAWVIKKQEESIAVLSQQNQASTAAIASLISENEAVRAEARRLRVELNEMQDRVAEIDAIKATLTSLSGALQHIESKGTAVRVVKSGVNSPQK